MPCGNGVPVSFELFQPRGILGRHEVEVSVPGVSKRGVVWRFLST